MDCQEALLGEEGITDANMLDCLGAVEDKVNEILSRYRQLGCDGPPPGTKIEATKSSSSSPSVSAAARRHLQHQQQQQNHQITSPPPLPPSSSRPNLLGEGPSQPMAPDPIYVMPPRLEDDMDDDDHPTPNTGSFEKGRIAKTSEAFARGDGGRSLKKAPFSNGMR